MFKSIMTLKERKCIVALKEICKKYEMDDFYSIGEKCEQRICICKREVIWEVFVVERGLEFDNKIYEDCIDACIKVIEYCSYCDKEFEDALRDLKNKLQKYMQNKIMIKKQCKL